VEHGEGSRGPQAAGLLWNYRKGQRQKKNEMERDGEDGERQLRVAERLYWGRNQSRILRRKEAQTGKGGANATRKGQGGMAKAVAAPRKEDDGGTFGEKMG